MADDILCPGDCEGTGVVIGVGGMPFACGDCDGTGERRPVFLVTNVSGRDAWLSRRTRTFRCPDCGQRFCNVDLAIVDGPNFPGFVCDRDKGGCGAALHRHPLYPAAGQGTP